MMSDLLTIKKKILEDERIEELLNCLECKHIKKASNRYEAQLPAKFNKSSTRAVQVYLNDSMSCSIRNLGMSNIDIFGLVSFLVHDCTEEESILKNIPKSKKWICEKLGYWEFIRNNDLSEFEKSRPDPLEWLKEIRRKRKKNKVRDFGDNPTYGDDILELFYMFPYKPYIEQGITYETQKYFQIGYDVYSSRIIYPIHNREGQIISIKGRTTDPLYEEHDVYKFIYLINFNKMIEWYNWHRAIQHIQERKEVIIFESEKSCWLATQFGYPNCLAISGDDISLQQVKTIKELGIDTKIIIGMDKDKSKEDVQKQGEKFGKGRLVFAIEDKHELLSLKDKDAPVDKGKDVFERLYNEAHRLKI